MITWDSNVGSTSDFCSHARVRSRSRARTGLSRVHVDQIVCSHAR